MKERPTPASDVIRRRMQETRRENTGPEVSLRRLLHRSGLRYRVHRSPVAGCRAKADVVFPAVAVSVFVDGCFWHGCSKHGTWPKNNADWWRTKILANRQRDRRTDRMLRSAGWTVIRVWEHERPELATRRIMAVVRRKQGSADSR